MIIDCFSQQSKTLNIYETIRKTSFNWQEMTDILESVVSVD